jgi:lysophospholipase L1-like esterase
MFSYDGFHLTPIGYAIWADDLTKFINANFANTNLQEPDLSTYIFAGGTNGGLSGPFTAPYVWSPMTDAEKAMAIEQIFTLDFARDLAAMIPPHRAMATAAPAVHAGPAKRLEGATSLDPMP